MADKEQWDRHAAEFAGFYGDWLQRIFRSAIFVRADRAIEQIRRTPGASILDIGCGPGRNSVLFVKHAGASRVVAVDFAENMIQMARQSAERHGVADRCRFTAADFMHLDLAGETFDYTVALGVMDYLHDPLPMLRKMRAHTRRRLIASFPRFGLLTTPVRKLRFALRGMGVYWYTRSRAMRLLSEAGFGRAEALRCTSAEWLAIGVAGEPAGQ